MSCRRISLATEMFLIALLAVDLSAFRYLRWPALPALDFRPFHLVLSLLPMLNLLSILGFRFVRDPGARSPFATGLVAFGLVAMIAHAFCTWISPEWIKSISIVQIGPAFEFCRAQGLPFLIGESPEGYSYFRYYPALMCINSLVAQLIVAVLGGLGCVLMARISHSGRQRTLRAAPFA